MQIDIYTKVVLTVIAIGVGLLVFDQKPVKDAHAAALWGPISERVSAPNGNWYEFIPSGDGSGKDSVRLCWFSKRHKSTYDCQWWRSLPKVP